jgi:hypothetical protein
LQLRPDTNFGIACGKVNKIVVLDIDPRNGGDKTLKELMARLGELPPAPYVATGGGGWHRYFAYPEGRKLKGQPGIEIKSDGGLVVAPPSVHLSGRRYEWNRTPLEVAPPPLPDAWLAFLQRCHTECAEDAEYTNTPNVSEDTNAPEVRRAGPQQAANQSVDTTIQEAIAATMPSGTGERHLRIFQFVRRLKAIPELAGNPARQLLGLCQTWHQRALEKIGTKEFQVSWADFQFAWEEVRCPWGTTPMDRVFAQALREEPPAQAVTLYGRDSLRTQLAALCRALQRAAGVGPFFLSTRQVGDALQVSPRHGGRWLRQLCHDNLLKQVSKGTLKDHQASEFHYLGD